MDIQAELAQLGRDIRHLKIDFDRFLNGALQTPPEDRRDKLIADLRSLHERVGHSFAERFLLNSLEARFNALNELYNRRLREHERGAERAAEAAGPDPRSGVVLESSGSAAVAEALYSALYGADGRRAKTDLDSFTRFLNKKADKIRRVTGCQQVQFRVEGRGGNLKLKARPVGAEEEG